MAPSAQTKKLILDGSLFVLSQVAFYYAFKVRHRQKSILLVPRTPPPADTPALSRTHRSS